MLTSPEVKPKWLCSVRIDGGASLFEVTQGDFRCCNGREGDGLLSVVLNMGTRNWDGFIVWRART